MIIKVIYKTIRSILFSVTLFIVGVYALTYALLSVPAFTNWVKDLATNEISQFLGGQVVIQDFDIYPFNEVKISGLEVLDPTGEECLKIETVGAGINLWKLILEHKIELTFGEIIGLDLSVIQEEKNGPLNIDFIIEAFSPKNKNQEKKKFQLALKNVVIRKSRASFIREWAKDQKIGNIDMQRLQIEDLAADIAFPLISDKGIEIDLRRLSLDMPGISSIKTLAFTGKFNPDVLFVKDLSLQLPASEINIPEIKVPLAEGKQLSDILNQQILSLEIQDSFITPADFSALQPSLSEFKEPLNLYLTANGNLQHVSFEKFYLGNPDVLKLFLMGEASNISNTENLNFDAKNIDLFISSNTFIKIQNSLPHLAPTLNHAIGNIGDFFLKGNIAAGLKNKDLNTEIDLECDAFRIIAEASFAQNSNKSFTADGEIEISDLRLNKLLPKYPLDNINANIIFDTQGINKNIDGTVNLELHDFEMKGIKYDGLSLNIYKQGEAFDGDLLVNNAIAQIYANFSGDIADEAKSIRLDADISRLDMSRVIDMKKYAGYIIAGSINLDGQGNDIDNIQGDLHLNNFSFTSPDNFKQLKLNHLNLSSELIDTIHSINLRSDWVDLRAEGDIKVVDLPNQLYNLAYSVFPSIINPPKKDTLRGSDLEFDALIKKDNSLTEFFNLPVRLLVPVSISGTLEGESNTGSLTIDIPYLQQGKDKLIYDTRLLADINADTGILNALFTTALPVKKGDLALNINLFAQNNSISTDIHFENSENSDFKGLIKLNTDLSLNEFTRNPEINLNILPSLLNLGSAEWNIAQSNISYRDKNINIQDFKIWHGDQLVEINGVASPDYADEVKLTLADIDVDYIFDMLQINYVTFGGVATGEITGHALLSNNPIAETESLTIKEFTYNGASLGVCRASSRWNNDAKEIEISAIISDKGRDHVKGSGGIWLGRDSLSFDINANKVPVDFVQPFMSVFSSHVGGFASGDVKLFGTFHDIDMTGKIFADSVAVKLDYTNTIYHGSDSVILTPGKIDIPHFRLFDKFGNSAMLTGELTHNYFHDPSFTFRLADANNFLCYDTSSEINPDWYGTLFGTGSALLKGVPGLVDISADMSVGGNSIFTFVLSDTQYAQDYQFLTFSDRRKQEAEKNTSLTPEDFKAILKKSMQTDEGGHSSFNIDIRASITPQVLFILVMDPAAGDKITARGQGPMQVKYASDNDEMMMYGKYEILEGNYNFSLQDIILRDFKIKEGSSISFNGNPLAADLDISATYRVNTNLSDLDKSFSTDRDLNRTNVPVDAVLSVTGNMQQPDINFDIELPTLTQDVERKVKSIISTEDMMNRQMIYLLALNRFYTPEYMGSTGSGGELTAVASSTISSQLSNMLGQLTDKFSLSPSFRSDKGDFSDLEVDVALSSKLLNNRLLINGNFGYRDRSNSSTTFVGDFDVEYLLSKNGNLRLKAYNHFNDQNYYLREALTTQGLGVVYRRDFDNWFTFLKPKKKSSEKQKEETENIKTTEVAPDDAIDTNLNDDSDD